ncbi:hypothetical protein HUJ04_006957 [Dendroctonus ponderosae]|nr:hypothetical protein HUJ04_006957 [Dendroctonus ponderosae]
MYSDDPDSESDVAVGDFANGGERIPLLSILEVVKVHQLLIFALEKGAYLGACSPFGAKLNHSHWGWKEASVPNSGGGCVSQYWDMFSFFLLSIEPNEDHWDSEDDLPYFPKASATGLCSGQTCMLCKSLAVMQINRNKIIFGSKFDDGHKKSPSYRDYWSSSPQMRDPFISSAISRNRFPCLLGNIHLNDSSIQPDQNYSHFDKLYKLRPVLDKLSGTFLNPLTITLTQ